MYSSLFRHILNFFIGPLSSTDTEFETLKLQVYKPFLNLKISKVLIECVAHVINQFFIGPLYSTVTKFEWLNAVFMTRPPRTLMPLKKKIIPLFYSQKVKPIILTE